MLWCLDLLQSDSLALGDGGCCTCKCNTVETSDTGALKSEYFPPANETPQKPSLLSTVKVDVETNSAGNVFILYFKTDLFKIAFPP